MKVGGWGIRALGVWLLVQEGWKLLAMSRWEAEALLHLFGIAAGFLILADGVRAGDKRAGKAAP
jgi:hypothetical protein